MIKIYCVLNMPAQLTNVPIYYTDDLVNTVQNEIQNALKYTTGAYDLKIPLSIPTGNQGYEITDILYRNGAPWEHKTEYSRREQNFHNPQRDTALWCLPPDRPIVFGSEWYSWSATGSANELDQWVRDQFFMDIAPGVAPAAPTSIYNRHQLWLELNGTYKYARQSNTLLDCTLKTLTAHMVWNNDNISPLTTYWKSIPMVWTSQLSKLNRYERIIHAW